MIPMTLGRFIRLKRQEKCLTQAEMAKNVQMQQYEISLLELSKKPAPKYAKLVQIAQTLEINPDLLLLMAGRVPRDIQQSIALNPDHNSLFFLTAFKKMRTPHG